MTTERSLQVLSAKVYELDFNHENQNPLKIGEIKEFGGLEYKIIKVEDNITNGMQAMAVAPVKNDVVDTSKIVIAYAGTSPDEGLDILTDARTVIVGSKLLDTSKLFKPAESLIDGQIICVENGLTG